MEAAAATAIADRVGETRVRTGALHEQIQATQPLKSRRGWDDLRLRPRLLRPLPGVRHPRKARGEENETVERLRREPRREAVQDALTTGLGYAVVGGIREGRSDDRNIGYVWVESVRTDTSHALDEIITLGVRVFLQWKAQEGTHRDVTALESLVESIQTILKPNVSTLGPWLIQVIDVTPDYANMHVTATVEGWQQNLFAV